MGSLERQKNNKKLTANELEKILADHKLWLDSHGQSGQRAILDDTNLSSLSMRNRKLRFASMKRVYAPFVDFSNSDLSNVDAADCDFYDSKFNNSNFSQAKFIDCDFNNALFNDSYMKNASFNRCDLVNANVTNTDFFNVCIIEKCNTLCAYVDKIGKTDNDLIHKILYKSDQKIKNESKIDDLKKIGKEWSRDEHQRIYFDFESFKDAGEFDFSAFMLMMSCKLYFDIKAKEFCLKFDPYKYFERDSQRSCIIKYGKIDKQPLLDDCVAAILKKIGEIK